MKKDVFKFDIFAHSLVAIILFIFFGTIIAGFLPAQIEVYPHSFISSFQSIECVGSNCMVNYIDDENDSELNSCYVNIKNSDADTYKVKKTKVYYNDHKCSLSLIKIHNKNNIDYLIIDIIVILVAIYFIYPQIKWTIESIINYNLMKHFENHKPLVFEDVECTSKKVGKLLNKKTFNVELKVNIKNHGEVLINKKVESYGAIKHINVLIDPDNTKKVLLLEDYELKEYKKYSK